MHSTLREKTTEKVRSVICGRIILLVKTQNRTKAELTFVVFFGAGIRISFLRKKYFCSSLLVAWNVIWLLLTSNTVENHCGCAVCGKYNGSGPYPHCLFVCPKNKKVQQAKLVWSFFKAWVFIQFLSEKVKDLDFAVQCSIYVCGWLHNV